MNTSCTLRGTTLSDDVMPDESLLSMDNFDVIEIPLLLSGSQMSALEEAAYLRGLTAAEMVRHLLREFLECQP